MKCIFQGYFSQGPQQQKAWNLKHIFKSTPRAKEVDILQYFSKGP